MQVTSLRIEQEVFDKIRKYVLTEKTKGVKISINSFFTDAILEKLQTIGGENETAGENHQMVG